MPVGVRAAEAPQAKAIHHLRGSGSGIRLFVWAIQTR
jgi:hypothetical protein